MRSYFENFVKYVFIISKSCYNILLVNAFVIVFIINCEHRLLVLLVIVRLKFFKNNLSPTNALRLEAIYTVGSTSKRKTSLSRTLVMLFKFLYDGWILIYQATCKNLEIVTNHFGTSSALLIFIRNVCVIYRFSCAS